MALDRACTAHGPPTESAHCFDLGNRGKEETCRRTEEGERQKMGFSTWTEAIIAASRQYLRYLRYRKNCL